MTHTYFTWADSAGIVHILSLDLHEMLCTGLYRINPDRTETQVPTCLLCIGSAGRQARRTGEPGIVEWKVRMPDG